VYGVVLAFERPISPHWEWAVSLAEPPPVAEFPQFYTARMVSVVLGSLLVLVIALANPLVGLLLAVHTYSIKYTAQVYLEALPFLLSALAVFAYLRSERKKKGWLVLSGVLLGLTAGSKYVYALVGIVIFLDWLRAHITAPRALRLGLRKGLLRVLMWGGHCTNHLCRPRSLSLARRVRTSGGFGEISLELSAGRVCHDNQLSLVAAHGVAHPERCIAS